MVRHKMKLKIIQNKYKKPIHRIAALIMPRNKYFCGGTLVSNRKVVTGENLKDISHFMLNTNIYSQLLIAW